MTQTVLKIVSVITAIVIVAVVARLDAHADIAPNIIYQGADIIGKTAEVGIAPGVSVYVPGTNCIDDSAQITTEHYTEAAQGSSQQQEMSVKSDNMQANTENGIKNVENSAKSAGPDTGSTKQHEYSNISISDTEMEELKQIVAAEAQTQSMAGREAVVEVIFNRVLSPEYPNTVHGVLSQKGQFATWKMRNASWVVPDAATAAIEHVMSEGRTVLPDTSYVYFDTRGTNGRKHIKIGAHYFGK